MSKKLPHGWKKVKLGDLVKVEGGYAFKSSEFVENQLPIIRIGNITEKGIKLDYRVCYTSDFQQVDKYKIINGDILIAMSGATTGKLAMYNMGTLALLNQRVGRFNILDRKLLNNKFLMYILKSKDIQQKIIFMASGCAQPNISGKQLESIEFNLPPLEEQERIVSILERAEDAISKREESNRLLDEYLKSVFVDMFGDPVTNPKGWDLKTFNEVFDISSSTRVLKSEWRSQGIPFYRVRDMVKLSECGVVDNEFFVSEEFYSSLSSSKGTPQEGDIMVSATSTIGKCYIVKENEKFYYKDADVLRFRKKIDIYPKYFVHFMKTPFAINQIKSTFGITTVPHFTIVNAKKINMLYPPYELQNQFEDIVRKVEKMKLEMEESLEALKNNFNSLMQRAFNGEL